MTPTYVLLAVISFTLSRALAETILGSSPAWTLLKGDRKLVSLSGNTTSCPQSVQDGAKGLSLGPSTIAQLQFNETSSLTVRGGGGAGTINFNDGAINFTTKSDTGDDACSLLFKATGLAEFTQVLAISGLDATRPLVIAAVEIDGTVLQPNPGPPPPPENVALARGMRVASFAGMVSASLVIALLV